MRYFVVNVEFIHVCTNCDIQIQIAITLLFFTPVCLCFFCFLLKLLGSMPFGPDLDVVAFL